jgi:hypothetical protein
MKAPARFGGAKETWHFSILLNPILVKGAQKE